MSLRKQGAVMASGAATWGLQHIAHRPAANMPGKIALKIDPTIIQEQTHKLTKGSIVVVGTNGKTTITNMIADALELSGKTIACNRTGANLAYGVASTLLQTKTPVEWGVFESDELWLAKTLPQLQATYVVLLNLFRDQLDRCGEIDRIQEAIISALEASPDTTLIYNADDPLCATIAKRVNNTNVAFGVSEDMKLAQNTVVDAQMCHFCSGMFEYEYRQYGQLGKYTCAHCGFTRPALDYCANNITIANNITFDVYQGERAANTTLSKEASCNEQADTALAHLLAPQASPYMVYNVLATYVACHIMGVSNEVFQKAIDLFDPQNGRLQHMTIEGRPVLLNLAKNPTGFNQNLKIITAAPPKKVVAFFINDNEADGHDISWIWDCDFEELAQEEEIIVFAGGTRKYDLQVRLKYAGITAQTIDSVNEMVDVALNMPKEWNMFAMANYTSLPAVRSTLTARADKTPPETPREGSTIPPFSSQPINAEISTLACSEDTRKSLQEKPLRIVHMFPDLLNLYGDGGNVRILQQRCIWRGIPVEVERVHYGDSVKLSNADIVFLGGGPDREQKLASEVLHSLKDDIASYVHNHGVLLAICGGYQILGANWLMGEESVEGLSILDLHTERAGVGFDRLIDNIVLKSSLAQHPVVGYENHAGRTMLGASETAFGTVISNVGHGNNDNSGADGVLHDHVIGTYLHGPLLSKNPEIADWIIQTALEQRTGHTCTLPQLNDDEELRANEFMATRLKA